MHFLYYFQEGTLSELHSSNPTLDNVNKENQLLTKQDGESEKPFSKELSGRVQRVFFERVLTSDKSLPFLLNLRDKYKQNSETNKESEKLRYVFNDLYCL